MAGYSGFKEYQYDYNSGLYFDNDGFVSAYTDGCCFGNGQYGAQAGIGVYFAKKHELNVSEPLSGRPTNNRAEIQAAIRAIDNALSVGIDKICIHTDSQFLINSATKWMRGWKRFNWTLRNGQPVKNRDDFIELDAAMQQMHVRWRYVPAHQGHIGNERADKLARDGAAMY